MTLLQQALEALEYHTAQTRPIERTNEAITALREAIAQGAVVQQWRPISEAPMSGYVLVHEDGAMRALIRNEGEWQIVGYPAIICQPWGDALVGDDAKRVLPMGCTLEIRDGCCEDPTHFMELPPAPKEQA